MLVLAFALVLAGPADDAFGHSGGPVPEARLSSQGSVVEVVWTAAPDDAAAIGAVIGALPESASYAYLGGDTDDLPSDREIAAFSRSPELERYLLDNVRIVQDDMPCEGTAEPAEDFIADGARLSFACPRHVVRAEVSITILHDDDPTYRTFSVDGTEQFAMHTLTAPAHDWDFAATQDTGRIPPSFGAAAVILLLGGVGSLRLLGPDRRSRRAAMRT